MNERIHNLLTLCMEAKKKGYNVFFNYSPHVEKVSIYQFQDNATFEEYETLERVATFDFYLDAVSADYTIHNAAEYLRELIGCDIDAST